MESDKHYFFEGLFIIVFTLAAIAAFVWLAKSGNRDDMLYRIRFNESVSGMSVGDPVKFRGVDVGTVKAMAIDPDDPRRVQVEIKLRKETPVKTDTKAILKLKGLTGNVFVELNGGGPKSDFLAAATPVGQVPEIPSEKSNLTTFLDELPKLAQKFSVIENKTSKVLDDVGEVTAKVKENPSILLRGPKEPPRAAANERPKGNGNKAP
jgi:phospholipid/cholesterol/gamma-HCH transport system substrate-binding protein